MRKIILYKTGKDQYSIKVPEIGGCYFAECDFNSLVHTLLSVCSPKEDYYIQFGEKVGLDLFQQGYLCEIIGARNKIVGLQNKITKIEKDMKERENLKEK